MKSKKSRIRRSFEKSRVLRAAAVLAMGVLIGGFAYYYVKNDTQDDVTQELGRASSSLRSAPSFELSDASGKNHRIRDFKGKFVMIHFWASWCPPCLDEIPQWAELANEFKNDPVQLVAISLDKSWEDAHKVLPSKSLGQNILSLLDPSSKTSDEYGSFQFPETYLVNRELKILNKWVGPQNWGDPKLLSAIRRVFSMSSKSGEPNSR